MSVGIVELKILKNKLQGPSLKKIIAESGLTKYRIAKDCCVSYQTLLNWINGHVVPSDDNAITIGRYLGLIEATQAGKKKIKKEIDALVRKMDAMD